MFTVSPGGSFNTSGSQYNIWLRSVRLQITARYYHSRSVLDKVGGGREAGCVTDIMVCGVLPTGCSHGHIYRHRPPPPGACHPSNNNIMNTAPNHHQRGAALVTAAIPGCLAPANTTRHVASSASQAYGINSTANTSEQRRCTASTNTAPFGSPSRHLVIRVVTNGMAHQRQHRTAMHRQRRRTAPR